MGIATAGLMSAAFAAAPPPDPCKLVTSAELEAVVGALKASPKPGNIKGGDVSCEYTPAKGPDWIEVRLHDGELAHWKSRQGGKKPVALPELGKDAFANPDSEGSADLFVKKGPWVLRVSMPKGPTAIGQLKVIAQKALARL